MTLRSAEQRRKTGYIEWRGRTQREKSLLPIPLSKSDNGTRRNFHAPQDRMDGRSVNTVNNRDIEFTGEFYIYATYVS